MRRKITITTPEAQPDSKIACPICGLPAPSPHHIKPRSMGGTDDKRNIIYFCPTCHDIVEQIQEERGVFVSPDLIDEIRLKRKIKLGETSGGISASYINREYDGKNYIMLSWIVLPNNTKAIVNQWVGEHPPEPSTVISAPIDIVVKTAQKRGRPINEAIDTKYIVELIDNKGLSLRGAATQLQSEGFIVSHEFIRQRLASVSPRIHDDVTCKRPGCGNVFTPEGTRRVYCSPECYYIDQRKPRRLVTMPISQGVTP